MKLAPDPAPPGARCAAHAEADADSVCSRCGNFMCKVCSDSRMGMLCPACRQALGTFPLKRDDYDFTRVWGIAFDSWRRDIVMLGIAGFIFMALSAVGNVVFQVFSVPAQTMLASGKKDNIAAAIVLLILSFVVGFAAIIVAQGVGILGLVRLGMDSLHAKKIELGRMFSQTKKLGRYVGIQLLLAFGIGVPIIVIFGAAFALAVLVGGGGFSAHGIDTAFKGPAPFLILGLAFLAVMVVMIYVTIPLSLAQFELVYSGCSAMDAIRRAWTLGDGHRLQIFGYTFVAGLAVMAMFIVGLMAFCVGAIIAMPIGYAFLFTMQSAIFLTLRNGSGLPLPEEPSNA
jgi:hypothetical protein